MFLMYYFWLDLKKQNTAKYVWKFITKRRYYSRNFTWNLKYIPTEILQNDDAEDIFFSL